MQALEGLRILGWLDRPMRYRLVVGPKRNDEAVTNVPTRLDSRLKGGHRTLSFGKPLSKLHFKLGTSPIASTLFHNPTKNVTRQQAHG